MRALLLFLAVLVAAPAGAAAQASDTPRVLFAPGGTVPVRLRRTVSRLLSSNAVLVSYEDYVRACNEAGVRPSSARAVRRVGTQQNATVIVVGSYGGHYRRRMLRLRYYSGSSGELMTSGNYALRGQHLRPSSQHAILRDLATVTGGAPPPAQASAASEEPSSEAEGEGGDLPPPLDWEAQEAAAAEEAAAEPAPEEASDGEATPLSEQKQWGFAVSAGAGIAQRSSSIPMEGGAARLSTIPFPAIQAQVLGYVRPDASSRYRLALAVRYTTSVGLQGRDERADGSTRTTDMRAHHLAIGLRNDIPLAPGERPTRLQLEVGWGFRMLDSEIPVSIPDYTLSGIYARIGLWFHIGDSPLSLGIVPEIGHVGSLSDDLSQSGQVQDGFLVGAEAHVRLEVIPEVSIHLLYREAHAFLGSAREGGGEMNDAERYGILRAEYQF
ncbi:MAG: hypothetical protein SangKO_054240 [Sandaracinaceae bacterium]|nr:MAG: hypothetical protein EVA89_35995 [Sandaracinaceae bacterium]